MIRYLFKLFVCALFLFPLSSTGQEGAGGNPSKTSGTAAVNTRAERKKDRKKWKEQRRKEKLDRKVVKQHHKKLQTKKVRKRMKKDKRKANRTNENKREFFLKRWFSKKQRGS